MTTSNMAKTVAELYRQRNASIRKMRKAGRTLVSIADEFGVSKQRIHQICNGNYKKWRKPKAPL